MDWLFSVAWCLVPRAKTKWDSPSPPVTNRSWSSFTDSSCWPEFQRSRYRWDTGVRPREGDSDGGVGRGLHCTAVNSNPAPSGAPPVSLISTTSGCKPANVRKKKQPPQCSCCQWGITGALLILSPYLSMSAIFLSTFVTKLTCSDWSVQRDSGFNGWIPVGKLLS